MCWRSCTAASATSWSTNTRTPTSLSTCGCGCLAQGRRNVCVVGDDDQSIYGWRGAEVDNILRFERDFPGAQVVRLERNYRSTEHILSAANGLIAENKARLGKNLSTEAGSGEKVAVRGVWDGEAEARLVADEIERWKKQGLGVGADAQGPRKYKRVRRAGARLASRCAPSRSGSSCCRCPTW